MTNANQTKKELTITRVFDAPRELVWKAWTTPAGFAAWYGQPWQVPPESVAMDVRVGGRWKSTTIAEGNTINFIGEFRQVSKPEKLVMTVENPDNPSDPNFELVTVVLKDLGNNKTEMRFKQEGNLPPEEYQTGLKQGWGGFFDALQKYLEHK